MPASGMPQAREGGDTRSRGTVRERLSPLKAGHTLHCPGWAWAPLLFCPPSQAPPATFHVLLKGSDEGMLCFYILGGIFAAATHCRGKAVRLAKKELRTSASPKKHQVPHTPFRVTIGGGGHSVSERSGFGPDSLPGNMRVAPAEVPCLARASLLNRRG